MASADRPARKSSRRKSPASPRNVRPGKPGKVDQADRPGKAREAAPLPDPLEADFGPEFDPAAAAAPDDPAAAEERAAAASDAAAAAGAAVAAAAAEAAARAGAAAGGETDGGAAPEPYAAPGARRSAAASGLFPGVACGGEACLLSPVANLFAKFGLRMVRGRGASLSRVAFSSIELMKALRDFLDEEIALAEKAAGGGEAPRYEKIPLD